MTGGLSSRETIGPATFDVLSRFTYLSN